VVEKGLIRVTDVLIHYQGMSGADDMDQLKSDTELASSFHFCTTKLGSVTLKVTGEGITS